MILRKPDKETVYYCIGIFFPAVFLILFLIGIGEALLCHSPPKWLMAGKFLMSSIMMAGTVAYISWRRFESLRLMIPENKGKWVMVVLLGVYTVLLFVTWYFESMT